jgi:hypothetical protein
MIDIGWLDHRASSVRKRRAYQLSQRNYCRSIAPKPGEKKKMKRSDTSESRGTKFLFPHFPK